MLGLLKVGPKFTRPACRAAAAIDRYLLSAPDLSSKPPTPLLLSIDGTYRRTLDHFMTLTAHYAYRVISCDREC